MSEKTYDETRTWVVTGTAYHTITAEWNRRKWTPPESVVKLDEEIVSHSTFWSRHLYYGAHVVRLNDVSDHPIVLKYHEKAGYVLFVDGRRVSSAEEQQRVSGSIRGPLDSSTSRGERAPAAAAAG
jgi:hypothetical protein